MLRTSDSHPLRVDWITAPGLAPLGLAEAAGRCDEEDHCERDLADDLRRLRDGYGVQVLASVLESSEFHALRIGATVVKAEDYGIEFLMFPIRAGAAPTHQAKAAAFFARLATRLREGRSVVVQCRRGRMRAALAVACVLRDAGLSAEEALAAVDKVRPDVLREGPLAKFFHAYGASR